MLLYCLSLPHFILPSAALATGRRLPHVTRHHGGQLEGQRKPPTPSAPVSPPDSAADYFPNQVFTHQHIGNIDSRPPSSHHNHHQHYQHQPLVAPPAAHRQPRVAQVAAAVAAQSRLAMRSTSLDAAAMQLDQQPLGKAGRPLDDALDAIVPVYHRQPMRAGGQAAALLASAVAPAPAPVPALRYGQAALVGGRRPRLHSLNTEYRLGSRCGAAYPADL